jgi:hypothetical protein
MRVRIYSGGLFPLALLIFGRWSPLMFVLGVVFIALGESLRLYSAGMIHKDKELSRTGPYAMCRNPLYLGTILIQLGFGLLSGSWLLALITLAWFVFIYTWFILLEEKWLAGLFGAEYADYLRTTPRLLPTFRSLAAMRKGVQHSWKQAKVNHELKSAAISVIGTLLFLIKYIFALWSLPLKLW